ncbi:MAG: hypothetical protein NZ557_01045 [Chthonomonadaceae bacterium]|nr:hypothetical protein [Chthonomonadaceae bacterium]
MSLRQRVATLITGVVLICAGPCLLQAQPAATAIAAVESGAAPGGASAVQSEILFGQNIRGPYRLGWKGIRAGSETVVRDGVRLARNVDYTLDPVNGVLAFHEPLRSTSMVRITYRCDTPEAAPNTGPLLTHMQFDLFAAGRNRATLLTQFQPVAGTTGPTVLPLLQLHMGQALGPADLSSALWLDLRGGDLWNRSAARITESLRFGGAELALGYTRAGAQFAHGKVAGLTPGREVMEAAGRFALTPGITLNSYLRQTTALPDDNARGPQTVEQGASVNARLSTTTTLQAGRTETRTTATGDTGNVRVEDRVHVESTLAPQTRIALGYTGTVTRPDGDAAGPQTITQTASMEFHTRPNAQYLLTGGYRNVLGPNGAQDIAGLKVEATPFSRIRDLRLRAALEERYTQEGAYRNREAHVELPVLPFAQTQVTGGVRAADDPTGDRLIGLLDVRMRPNRHMELTGNARLRSGMRNGLPDTDLADTYVATLAITPNPQLRLTAGFTQNPGLNDTFRRASLRSIGLETRFGNASLRGKYGVEDEYVAARLARIAEMALDLRLSRWHSLTTGYQTRSFYGADWLTEDTYSFAFRHELGARFNLSLGGSMTLHGRNGTVDNSRTEIRGEARLGVRF